MNNKIFQFYTLQDISFDELLCVFNQCFENYFVAVNLTGDRFSAKIKLEDIDLLYSAGCFTNDNLVGFILHGKRFNYLYNAGTGILPQYRGLNLVGKMYAFLLTQSQMKSIEKISLEVITDNNIAVRTYQKFGFKITDHLLCYRINSIDSAITTLHTITESNNANLINSSLFWDEEPQWQNNILYKINSIEKLKLIISWIDNICTGYILFNSENNRIIQICVHKDYRLQKIASSMLHYLNNNYTKDLMIINVSNKNTSLIKFFNYIKAECYLQQYKMEINLSEIP